MATLAQFSQNIRKRGSQIENAGTRFVKSTTKRALKKLVNTTPVDTGKARSNWRVGIGAPVRSPIETYGSASAARAAINAGFARINSVRGVSGGGGGLPDGAARAVASSGNAGSDSGSGVWISARARTDVGPGGAGAEQFLRVWRGEREPCAEEVVMSRVFVEGYGIVSPAGWGVEAFRNL